MSSQQQGDTNIAPKQEESAAPSQAQPTSSLPKSSPIAAKDTAITESAAQPAGSQGQATTAEGLQDPSGCPPKEAGAPSADLSIDDLIHSGAAGTPDEGGCAVVIPKQGHKDGAGEATKEKAEPQDGTTESSVDRKAVEAITAAEGTGTGDTAKAATDVADATAKDKPANEDTAKVAEETKAAAATPSGSLKSDGDTAVDAKAEELKSSGNTPHQAVKDSANGVESRNASSSSKTTFSPDRRAESMQGRAKSVRGGGVATRSSTSSKTAAPSGSSKVASKQEPLDGEDGPAALDTNEDNEEASSHDMATSRRRGAPREATYAKAKGRKANIKAEQKPSDGEESERDDQDGADPAPSSSNTKAPSKAAKMASKQASSSRSAKLDEGKAKAKRGRAQGDEEQEEAEVDQEDDHDEGESAPRSSRSKKTAKPASSKKTPPKRARRGTAKKEGDEQGDDEGGDDENDAESEAAPQASTSKASKAAGSSAKKSVKRGRNAKDEDEGADDNDDVAQSDNARRSSPAKRTKVATGSKQRANRAGQQEDKDDDEDQEAEDDETGKDDDAPGPSKASKAMGSGKKATTAKTSWIDKLPHPSPPQGKARTTLDDQDHLAVWLQIFKNFNEWVPPQGGAVNRYQWLEREMGINAKHKYGEGEHIRSSYTTFVKNVLNFVSAGCKGEIKTPGATTEAKKKIKWNRVIELVFEGHKPQWQSLQSERELGKGGNEKLRQATNGVLAKIVKALDGR